MPAKVSVIVPAYNAGLFIENAINSILAQSYGGEVEILVIDDQSSDNTKALVADMARRHPQIILLRNERAKGPSGARNTGLLTASGSYIAFLDADDAWFSNHLEEGIGFLEKYPGIDVVFYNFEICDFATKRRFGDWFSEKGFTNKVTAENMGNQYFLINDNLFYALLEESFMHLQSMIVRKEALGEVLFNENLTRSEDRDFSIQLFAASHASVAYKNLVTGTYFRHGNSLTSGSLENNMMAIADHIKMFSGYLSDCPADATAVLKLKELLCNRYMCSAYGYRKLDQHALAMLCLAKSLRYRISYAQIVEFSKIMASFFVAHIIGQKGRMK